MTALRSLQGPGAFFAAPGYPTSTRNVSWGPPAGFLPFAPPGPQSRTQIEAERQWRQRPAGAAASTIQVSRWKIIGSPLASATVVLDDGCLTIAVALRPSDVTLSISGSSARQGVWPAGMVQVTAPGSRATAEYRAPCDVLHLFVPVLLLEKVSREAGAEDWRKLLDEKAPPALDPAIERLARSLLEVGDFEGGAAEFYVEGIARAILARLLSRGLARLPSDPLCNRGLAKWRLKRVVDFVEAHLSAPITLADLARCAGLSRMHFAAQFRAATGIRPHEYLVRKRIERAQELLCVSSMPLVEVALSVGFQTQAHFTTVFRRFLNETPGRWRRLQRCQPDDRGLGSERLPPRHAGIGPGRPQL